MKDSKNKQLRLIYENIIINDNESITDYFKRMRKELQEFDEGTRNYYPVTKIATNLQIRKDMLQKKLNGQKPLTRNWLIAISAAHGLDDYETTKVLNKCKFPCLDEKVPQENFIIDFLCNYKRQPNTIEELNKFLLSNGCKELELNYRKRDNTNVPPTIPLKNLQYDITKIIRTYTYDEGDQYDSLETAYNLRHRCVAMAKLEENEIKLEAYNDGTLIVFKKGDFPQFYKNVNETEEFMYYFSELLSLAKQEERKVYAQLYDSKNYQGRLGGNIKNDMMHLFYEQYNYDLPKRNEYYLMEYIDGHFTLTVSQQSMFMKEYLSQNDYEKYYASMPKILRQTYSSIDDIILELSQPNLSYYHERILYSRKFAFKKFSNEITEALEKIKTRKLFIRNSDMIFENPLEICKYYHVENEFCCIHDNEYGELSSANDNAVFIYNNEKVIITFDELKRAFELGFIDTQQICRIKKEKGSIENIF